MRKFLFIFMYCVMLLPLTLWASSTAPAIHVIPFLSSATIASDTDLDVIIVAQNNTGVNQTITNLDPILPPDNLVRVTLLENNCGFLSPGASCEATYNLKSQSNIGNDNLNIKVCTYHGAMCSRIKEPIKITYAPLVAVQVSPTNPTIPQSTSQQFNATGLYADSTTQDITHSVTWSSSNLSVATISNSTGTNGLAFGVAAGTSSITAAIKGVSGSSTLTVTAATLTSIEVVPVNRTIPSGTFQQYFAIGHYSDNTFINLTSAVTWQSTNVAVATVSNATGSHGLAEAKSVGSTIISATLGIVSGSTRLDVTAGTLTSISVTPTNPSTAKGYTQQFTATGIYSDHTTSDLTDKVTWNTGSAIIAIISNRTGSKGLGLAINVGTTPVTATFGSIVGSTNFEVTPPVLASIDVSPRDGSLAAGRTLQYLATGIYSDNSEEDITNAATWRSSNTAAATISNAVGSKGLATSVAVGSTTIIAIQNGILGNTSLTVTPAVLTSIDVTPANPTIAKGTQQQFTATGTYSNATTKDITNDVTWAASDASVAIVSNAPGSHGLATSIDIGTTPINAALSGISGSTNLTVSAATLTSISVTPANASIPNTTTQQFIATGTYTDLSTHIITNEVTWGSTDTSIATISNASASKGLATGVQIGSTTIQAFYNSIIGSTTLSVIALQIGDSYGGGKVACLDGGMNNLIAATADNSSGKIWGGSGTITHAQSDTDGSTNTSLIVNTLGAGTTYAAGLCSAYEIDSAGNSPCVGGNTCYNDWFLASVNQLLCIRKNRTQVGGFSRSLYWSSTEYAASPASNAWSLTFANSGQSPVTSSKTNSFPVRCVRLIVQP